MVRYLALALLLGAAPVQYLSPVAVDVAGEQAIVAGAKLLIVDLGTGKVVKSIALPAPATGQCLSSDGRTAYVTCGEAKGRLAVVDLTAGKLIRAIDVGHSPVAPVLGADGRTVYLANRYLDRLAVIDTAAGRVTRTIQVIREPVAMAIIPGAGKLLVANHLPKMRADAPVVCAQLSVVDPVAGQQTATLDLPNGATSVRGLAISPDGKHGYVTHILARFQLPTTQLSRGWMNTNGVSIIDLAGLRLVNTVLLDRVDHGAANPWGVACSGDGRWLCVAASGTHEIVAIDREALHQRLARVARGKSVTEASIRAEDVPNDLGFLVGLSRRIPLRGNGPRALTTTADGVLAAEFFSNSLATVRLAGDEPEVAELPLQPDVPMTDERRGEMFFADASQCFQQWQSCTSCHPDGRADALNWDLLNDGIGNPKQTKSMLYAHRTPPAMLAGVRGSAEVAVRAGLRHIEFSVRPEADAKAIDAYLRSLTPVPSPYPMSASAKRGQAVFRAAGCAECHSGPLYTDLQQHDVGTAGGQDAQKPLDTPTLAELWRTAPYLSDGRAVTLREVIGEFNPGDRHGRTSGLSQQQTDDLVAYLLTL